MSEQAPQPQFTQVRVTLPDGTSMMVTGDQAALLDGVQTGKEAHDILDQRPDLFLCDFCSRPGAYVTYGIPDFRTGVFDLDGSEHISHGGWAACPVCDHLIEQHDRDGLVERALAAYFSKYPESVEHRTEIEAALRDLHDKFFARAPDLPEWMAYREDNDYDPEKVELLLFDRAWLIEGEHRILS